MSINKLNKDFLEEVKNTLDLYGDCGAAYGVIGDLLAAQFAESLIEAYQNDPEGFVSLSEVSSAH